MKSSEKACVISRALRDRVVPTRIRICVRSLARGRGGGEEASSGTSSGSAAPLVASIRCALRRRLLAAHLATHGISVPRPRAGSASKLIRRLQSEQAGSTGGGGGRFGCSGRNASVCHAPHLSCRLVNGWGVNVCRYLRTTG